jgi:putative Ca2+/H+ antiporter (TMEM165/GDT1 family)
LIAAVFGLVFLAELPDKTALASLVLGTRYRPLYVFTGAAGAFVLHVVLAIAAGSLLTLLPHRLLEFVVAALFVLGAVLMLRGRHGDKDEEHLDIKAGSAPTFARVPGTAFPVILVAEFGDLTQTRRRSGSARCSASGPWPPSRSSAAAACCAWCRSPWSPARPQP